MMMLSGLNYHDVVDDDDGDHDDIEIDDGDGNDDVGRYNCYQMKRLPYSWILN